MSFTILSRSQLLSRRKLFSSSTSMLPIYSSLLTNTNIIIPSTFLLVSQPFLSTSSLTSSFSTTTASKPSTTKSKSSSTPKTSPPATKSTPSSSPTAIPAGAWKRKPFTKRSNQEYLTETTVLEMDKNLMYLIKVGKPNPPTAAALDRLLRVIKTSSEFNIGIRAIYRSYTAKIKPSNDTATLFAIAAIRTNNIPKVLEIFNELQAWLPLSHGAMARLYKASSTVSSSSSSSSSSTTKDTKPTDKGTKVTKDSKDTNTATTPTPTLNSNEIMNKIHTITRHEDITLTANSTVTSMLSAIKLTNYRLGIRLVQEFINYRKSVNRKAKQTASANTTPATPSVTTTSSSSSGTNPGDLIKYIDSSVIRVYTKLLLSLVQSSMTTKKDPSSFNKTKLQEILSTLSVQDLSFLHLYNQVISQSVQMYRSTPPPSTTSATTPTKTNTVPKALEGLLTIVKPEVESVLVKQTEVENKLKEEAKKAKEATPAPAPAAAATTGAAATPAPAKKA